MTGETPEVRSDKRKPREKREESEQKEEREWSQSGPRCPQDVPKISARCPQDVIERIIKINGLSEN